MSSVYHRVSQFNEAHQCLGRSLPHIDEMIHSCNDSTDRRLIQLRRHDVHQCPDKVPEDTPAAVLISKGLYR
jgi:hypothetical protein